MKYIFVGVLAMLCLLEQSPIQAMTHEFLEKEHIALLKEQAEDVKKMKTMLAVTTTCVISAYCGYWAKKLVLKGNQEGGVSIDGTLMVIPFWISVFVPFVFAESMDVSKWVPGISMATTMFLDEASKK